MPEPSNTDSTQPSASDDPDPSSQPGNPWADPESPDGCHISLHLQTADTDPPAEGWLVPRLHEAAQHLGLISVQLDVTVVDDDEMTRLHGEFSGDPTTTDVLTFDMSERDPDAPHNTAQVKSVEGDLVICRPVAERQATQRKHDARLELLLYCVHGLMHLLGEDDHDEDAYQQMHQREDALLTAMGLGAIFGIESQGGDA